MFINALFHFLPYEASTGFHLKRQTQWYRNCTTLQLSIEAFYIQGMGYTVFLVDLAWIQRIKNSTCWSENSVMFSSTHRYQHILLRDCTKSLGNINRHGYDHERSSICHFLESPAAEWQATEG